jgi:hypothetical protein
MHELVTQRAAELLVIAAERQRDPALQVLREAEHAFRDVAGQNVRLLEVRIGGSRR